jgi:hypothetical protein
MGDPTTPPADPGIFRYVVGFLLIGLAWGFTTPFIRAAARMHKPPPHPILDSAAVKNSWMKTKLYGAFFGVIDLLRNPRYAIPLVINLTGSIWFFLLIGKAGELLCFYLELGGELGRGKWWRRLLGESLVGGRWEWRGRKAAEILA